MKLWELFRKKQPPVTVEEKPEERFILTIDGGGMRGIVPVVMLQTLEIKLRQQGFKGDIAKAFDLIAGTSTGGLISLALTCPANINKIEEYDGQTDLKELLNNYKTMGKIVFPQKTFTTLSFLASTKYPSYGIESQLMYWFGNTTLKEAKVPTLVVSYDLSRGQLKLFKSYEENNKLAWEVGRCTSAAPTYFSPYVTEEGVFVDGGVIANNPAMYAYLEGKKLYPNCKKFHILSLNTGGIYHTMEAKDTSNGIFGWADNIQPLFDTAQKRTVDINLQAMADVDYVRIDKGLPEPIKMDETNMDIINRMEDYSKIMANSVDDKLEYFASLLMKKEI
ncbi:MAG: patatin-like phospholipase family protein, partial [Sphaerochaetaceae bacterium]|nr:patatin-like phospholipase family protein [Sphaerochaetaceae bacterium]